jgi:hypothetical protein
MNPQGDLPGWASVRPCHSPENPCDPLVVVHFAAQQPHHPARIAYIAPMASGKCATARNRKPAKALGDRALPEARMVRKRQITWGRSEVNASLRPAQKSKRCAFVDCDVVGLVALDGILGFRLAALCDSF